MSMTGDADATTVLYLPGEKVLITGDVVSYPIPYVTRPQRHAETLRTLAAMHAAAIVPGHGDPELDRRYRDRVRAIVKAAVREARGGADL